MTLILKLGGSVITDKSSETPKVDKENLERLAKEIAGALKAKPQKLVLVHGAGSYGHQIVKKTGIDKGISKPEQLIAFAETQRLQNELNSIVTKELIKHEIPAIPCQASASAVMKKGRLTKLDYETVKNLLNLGMVPVLYGVPAYDTEQGCSILSGDQIAPFLAKHLNAEKVIHGTNVNGVFTADPNKNANAEQIPLITRQNFEQVKKALAGSTHVDVTGGMLGKVTELLQAAENGVESQIVNALEPGAVRKALEGQQNGTIIKAE